MTINNSNAMNSTNLINTHMGEYQKELQKIAAAKALDSTNGAAQTIYDDLQSQVNEYTQGIKNANDAIGYLQIADSTTQSLTNSADKLNVMSTQYNNAILSQDNKSAIISQADKLKESMKQSIQGASFNGKNVFGGEASFYTGGGSQTFSLNAPSVDNLDITNQNSISSFQKELSSLKSTIGSSVNAITSSINSNMSAITSISSASSQIGDTDYAVAANNLSSDGLKLNSATMSLAHNNSYLATKIEGLLR